MTQVNVRATAAPALLKSSYMRLPHPLTSAGAAEIQTAFVVPALKGFAMKAQLAMISVVAALMAASSAAEAKGCVKGAAVGGVAGHIAGHHGVLGAAAGCAVGRHRANKAAKRQQDQQQIRSSGAGTGRDTTPASSVAGKHG